MTVTIGPYDIVGVALVNNDDDDVGPGKGALLTEEGLLRIEGDLGDVALVVTTDGSLTPDAEAAHFTETFGPFLTVPSPQVDITNLQPIAAVPWAIAWFLGLLAAAVLFHALVNCTQLGRRQLSTMRALGFQSGQTRRSVVALAGLLAIPSALVGAGAGIVAGRWAWSLVSNASASRRRAADRGASSPQPVRSPSSPRCWWRWCLLEQRALASYWKACTRSDLGTTNRASALLGEQCVRRGELACHGADHRPVGDLVDARPTAHRGWHPIRDPRSPRLPPHQGHQRGDDLVASHRPRHGRPCRLPIDLTEVGPHHSHPLVRTRR